MLYPRVMYLLALLSFVVTTAGCSVGFGFVGHRLEPPKNRSVASSWSPKGWYKTKSGPLWNEYTYSSGFWTPGTKRPLDTGGWGLGFGLRYGLASPEIAGLETTRGSAWDAHVQLHTAPWTFAFGWGEEHGTLPDEGEIPHETTFSNIYFDVARQIGFLPMLLGIEIVPVLGIGWGKLDSTMHQESERAMNFRPGLRLMRILYANDMVSLVLSVDGRYTYSRAMDFASAEDNYKSRVLLFELSARL